MNVHRHPPGRFGVVYVGLSKSYTIPTSRKRYIDSYTKQTPADKQYINRSASLVDLEL